MRGSRLPADLEWVQERRGVGQDSVMRGDESDIMTEMAAPTPLLQFAPLGENDLSPKIAPPHQRRSESIFGFTQSRQARNGQLRDTRLYGR